MPSACHVLVRVIFLPSSPTFFSNREKRRARKRALTDRAPQEGLITRHSHSFTDSFTRSIAHSLIHSLIYSLMHYSTHAFTYSLIHLFTYLFTYSLIAQSLIHFLTPSLNHTFMHSLIYLFIHSFVHTFKCLDIHLGAWDILTYFFPEGPFFSFMKHILIEGLLCVVRCGYHGEHEGSSGEEWH